MERIKTQGKTLVDEHGRERIFNGFNVCDKGTYDPTTGKRVYGELWTPGLGEIFRKSGMNLVRLGFTWDAVEPEPGQYNEKFLDYLRTILDECAQNGVYVYLDMHQDLYSGFGDGPGDGAPAWATMTDKYTYTKPRFVWAEGYFWGKAVHAAFDNFWRNAPLDGVGVQDRYIAMWLHVIEKLGNHPAVLGFDVMNEPFPGKSGGEVFRRLIAAVAATTITDKAVSKKELIRRAMTDPARVLDLYDGAVLRKITKAADEIIRRFDTKKYAPFLCKITKAIRNTGCDKAVIMENCYYSNLGVPYSCPVPHVEGRKDESVLFAPHAYDFMVDTPQYKYASNERIAAIFAEHKRSQERLGVPVIVGEWGGFTEGNEWFHHIKFLLQLFDSNHWSQTYWSYFGGLADSDLYKDVLTRPHPVAVTGRIDSYSHDREQDTFTLTYTQEKDYDAPTEIFLHKTPTAVETDGEYTIEPLGEHTGRLLLHTTEGKHTVKIIFE